MGNCAAPAPTAATAPAERHRGGQRVSSGPLDRLNELYDLSAGRTLSFVGDTPLKTAKAWETGKRHAIRLFPIKRLTPEQHARLKGMVNKLKDCIHSHIAGVINVFEANEQLVVVSEFCGGGDVIHRLARTSYTERTVATYARFMLTALQGYHQHGVETLGCLRLDNFLFLSTKDDAPLKLVESGLKSYVSMVLRPEKSRVTIFTAPETLAGQPCPASDLWFIGVLVYLLLGGSPPFVGDDEEALKEAIKREELTFPLKTFERTSPGATDFIRGLLERSPARRMSMQEALIHPWLSNTNDAAIVGSRLVSARKYRRGGGLKEVSMRSGDEAVSSSDSTSVTSPRSSSNGSANNPTGLTAAKAGGKKASPKPPPKLNVNQMLDAFEANGLM